MPTKTHATQAIIRFPSVPSESKLTSKEGEEVTRQGVVIIREDGCRPVEKCDKATQFVGNHAMVQVDLLPPSMFTAVPEASKQMFINGVGYGSQEGGFSLYGGTAGRFAYEGSDYQLTGAQVTPEGQYRKQQQPPPLPSYPATQVSLVSEEIRKGKMMESRSPPCLSASILFSPLNKIRPILIRYQLPWRGCPLLCPRPHLT